MSLEEINNLSLDDVKKIIQNRVFYKKDPRPEYPSPLPEDFDEGVWHDGLFTQEELDTEFALYKQELLDTENERLRKQDLIDRFENLSDMRKTFHTVYPDLSNPAVFLRDLCNQEDHIDAEAKMAELEAKDVELRPSTAEIEFKQNIKIRNDDLLSEGISRDVMIEAIVRKEFLNDTQLYDSIKPKIETVDGRNPNARITQVKRRK